MKLNVTTIAVTTAIAMLTLAPLSAQAQDVNHRLHHQGERIRQGMHSGQLTRHEARVVRHDDRLIHAREHMGRLHHHGRLTWREKTRLEHRLNRNSKRIYRDKHNPWHRN